MGQTAERDYFGKPCGLMDQMASSVGGLVYMDFVDPVHPATERIDCDLGASGYGLFIVDSGTDHADLTADYAAIPAELEQVCRVFGAEVLRQVDETEFYRRLPAVRAAAGDRAALRAIHVFDENRRAAAEAEALQKRDFPAFLALVNASGASSWAVFGINISFANTLLSVSRNAKCFCTSNVPTNIWGVFSTISTTSPSASCPLRLA